MAWSKLSVSCLALLPGLLCAGCFEQKAAVSLHANRSGKVHVWRRSSAPTEDGSARARTALLDELARWEGVVAWAHERADVTKDQLDVEAVGYFEDANALVRDESGVGRQAYRLSAPEAGALELDWTFIPAKGWTTGDFARCKSVAKMLAGVQISGEITMPGAILSAEGATRGSEREASWVIFSGAELEREVADLDARVGRGELTQDEAAATLHAKYERRRATFTSRVAEDGGELDRFHAELTAARKAYDEGTLKKEIEERRKLKAPSEPEPVPADARDAAR